MILFDKYRGFGPWCLRLSMAATLWYSAWYSIEHLDGTLKMLQDVHVPGASVYLVWGLAVFFVIQGLSFILRLWRRPLAVLLCAFFVMTLITVPWSGPEMVWKDMVFLGVSLWWLLT